MAASTLVIGVWLQAHWARVLLVCAGPPMLRALVRLAFHDCASATCDGCIDVNDSRNNPGLEEMITVLQPICDKYSLGKADCWAAAGSIAVEETSFQGADVARVPLFFGRKDAATCSSFTAANPEAVFPSASVGVCSRLFRHGPCVLLPISTFVPGPARSSHVKHFYEASC